jgi:hypothetical protein
MVVRIDHVRAWLTTDGHGPYLYAVEGAFGVDIDYAMLVKHYGPTDAQDQRRYSPSEFVSAEKRVINGKPENAHISTSFVER